MNKEICEIQNYVLSNIESLDELAKSLQEEFEFFASANNPNELILKAKKRQLQQVKHLKEDMLKVFDSATYMADIKIKLEACCFYHGINAYEILSFLRMSKRNAQNEVAYMMKENMIQVPERLQFLLPEVSKKERKEILSEISQIIRTEQKRKISNS